MRRHCFTRLLAGIVLAAMAAAHAQGGSEPGPDWPAATTAEQAFDAKTFAGLDRSIAELTDIRSVVVIRRGRVAFEYHRDGYTQDTLHSVESVTKSVLSALVGIAHAQGRITSLDQPIVALMPELASVNTDPRAQQLTVRHLLTMTAGFKDSERRFYNPKEHAQFAMSRAFESAPGEAFRYDNWASDLLSAVLEKAIDEKPAAYAQRHLFGPLAIERSDWRVDERGHNLGHMGLSLSTRDVAKLGQLFMQDGVWAGKQIVPKDFALAATDRQNAGGPPMGLAYGFLWWISPASAPGRRTFIASGFGGQIVWVHQPLDLVVAVSSDISQASGDRNQAINLARRQVFGLVQRSQAEQPAAQ